jgi:hypothetical protein
MNWPQAFVAATGIVSFVVLFLGLAFLSTGPTVTWRRTATRPVQPAKRAPANDVGPDGAPR